MKRYFSVDLSDLGKCASLLQDSRWVSFGSPKYQSNSGRVCTVSSVTNQLQYQIGAAVGENFGGGNIVPLNQNNYFAAASPYSNSNQGKISESSVINSTT